ncbi:hypothetical protein C8R44DRAFT_885457 [Mycena epipterygia]|nr:hypothetical protein C8R44DRAFT_885457 [Mycena epipterygia]
MHDSNLPTILSNLDKRKPRRSLAPLIQSAATRVPVLPLRQRCSRPVPTELKKPEWNGGIAWEDLWQTAWQGFTDATLSDESLGAELDENNSTAEPSVADAAERAKEDAALAK